MNTLLRIATVAVLAATALSAQVQVDRKIPGYTRAEGVSGNIKSVGSDTMNNLMTRWAEGFQKLYPNVEIEIEGKGSSTAPTALIEGSASFGPMSREMKAKEQDDFDNKFGYRATQLIVGVDMLAVYVHKDNPLAKTGLTLAEVDAIFSKSRRAGHASDIRTWGELGLTGEWADKPISVFGRNSVSGTYGFFKEHVLGNGDFKDEVKEMPGSSAVVQGVASDKYAIGYSGIGYLTPHVCAVPLGKTKETITVATPDNVSKYPLSRPLLIYVNYKPNSQFEPLRREFVRYVFSAEGQTAVVQDQYLPLPFARCLASLKAVGLEMKPVASAVEAAGKTGTGNTESGKTDK